MSGARSTGPPGPPPAADIWQRPVPVVGDVTSAAERSGDPRGWALPDPVAAGLADVIAARRDVRRFRPDPVPDDLVTRVLRAGHAAPSVGHSQPWRFIVVRDPGSRQRAAAMADRERLTQASQLTPDRARRLLDLQLEGIREAPLGVVVACDRRAAPVGVLGRATFPDADLWSCACAIENIWLTARAAGLGLGWVTLFRPEDLAGLLHLPDGVQTLGWLCLGWPNERPPEPGLERHGWSRRTPLEDVVLNERWPDPDDGEPSTRRPPPAPPISHLRAPGPERVVGVGDANDLLLTPPGSLGILDRALNTLAAAGGPAATTGVLVLVGADHPVAALGVSPYRAGTTREVLAAAVAGHALGVAGARAAGLGVRVVDAGVEGPPLHGAEPARPLGPRGDLVGADALRTPDVTRLIGIGRRLGRSVAGTRLVALGEVGLGNTTVAAALACVLLDQPACDVVGLGAGADAAILQRKTEVVGSAVARVAAQHRPATGDPIDPVDLLAALGGPEIAVLVGVVLGAARAGACVVLDGLATTVAAALAVRVQPAVQAYLIAGHVSRERAHRAVLTDLGLEPLLDLRLRAGEGSGACLATGLLLDGLAIRRQTARTGRPAP